ncbi:MAG TPA: phosphoribosylformylglycinamidine synthase subunit PurS [Polyangiales bacterium]|nr:phosphoribosylformylglycinamidine synthase subunit PurS [Polyangiales bacterium]
MKANVYVTLKTEVLDPQGEAVKRALNALGFSGVQNVRVGKLIELELSPASPQTAATELRAMCEKLLANPIVEDFRFELDHGA